jgi:hypothetical protein
LIRQKWLDNDFYWIHFLQIQRRKLDFIFMEAGIKYEEPIFGKVIWARFASQV